MSTKSHSPVNKIPRRKALLGVVITLTLAALACVRSAPLGGEDPAAATQKSAETADAEIQQTLEALLASATIENVPTATPTIALATSTIDLAQLTALAATYTAAVPTATSELALAVTPSPSSTPKATTAPCYAARYVYDETYPDDTRVNPGESIQKVWRLQNVGTCDWTAGQYQLAFVSGDKMSGTSPLVINFTVPAGGYANFSVNLKAPVTPGTYRGNWILELKSSGDDIGLGPNADQPFWIQIVVRGATPTP